MGTGCDKMTEIAEDFYYWAFPPNVELPECVMELLRRLYPTIDWSTVTFHKGIPGLFKLGTQEGITLPGSYDLSRIHVFIKPSVWEFCSCTGLMRFVHEAFHVLQYRDAAGGSGLGLLRAFTLAYMSCPGQDDIEKPAYAQSDRYLDCCYHAGGVGSGGLTCDCSNPDAPTFRPAALDALVTHCPDLIRTSSGFSFWGTIWGCTPGLTSLWGLGGTLIEKGCKLGDDLGWNIARFLSYCVLAILGSLILRGIGLAWFVVWFAFWVVITLIATVIKYAVDIIVVAIDVILWFVRSIVCLAEWFWDKVGEACDWGTTTHAQCELWGEENRQECTATEEQRIQQCTLEEDRGHKDCCDWWPCSWACDAWVWVTNMVCVAWAWITHTVCVAWAWIKEKVCLAFTWVVTKVTCWK